MKARSTAFILLSMSLMIITAGCFPFSGYPIQYAESYELYDERDSKTVRAIPAHGNKFVIVKLELEFLGYADAPYDIRDRIEFELINPVTGDAIQNFYEDETWNFLDTIPPIFRTIGESHNGSIFFEVPNDDVSEYLVSAFANAGFYNAQVFRYRLSQLTHIPNYPENWD